MLNQLKIFYYHMVGSVPNEDRNHLLKSVLHLKYYFHNIYFGVIFIWFLFFSALIQHFFVVRSSFFRYFIYR